MKFLSKKQDEKGRTIITVQEGFFKKKVDYLALRQLSANFYEWVKLPGGVLAEDGKSFQLDVFKREAF